MICGDSLMSTFPYSFDKFARPTYFSVRSGRRANHTQDPRTSMNWVERWIGRLQGHVADATRPEHIGRKLCHATEPPASFSRSGSPEAATLTPEAA